MGSPSSFSSSSAEEIVSRLLAQLAAHVGEDSKEIHDVARIQAFAEVHPHLLSRSCSPGHVTGSAVVVEEGGGRVLLLFHRKLSRWLQPGGHLEEGEDPYQGACREVREETGLKSLHGLHEGSHGTAPPLDVDIHTIPARGSEPEHLHLDLRYLLLARHPEEMRMQREEARALRWFEWEEASGLGLDSATQRMLNKARRVMEARR